MGTLVDALLAHVEQATETFIGKVIYHVFLFFLMLPCFLTLFLPYSLSPPQFFVFWLTKFREDWEGEEEKDIEENKESGAGQGEKKEKEISWEKKENFEKKVKVAAFSSAMMSKILEILKKIEVKYQDY